MCVCVFSNLFSVSAEEGGDWRRIDGGAVLWNVCSREFSFLGLKEILERERKRKREEKEKEDGARGAIHAMVLCV